MTTNHGEVRDLAELDHLFLENVGDLTCTSSYDLVERVRVALLSVTVGEDKPLKCSSRFNSVDPASTTNMDSAGPCGFDRGWLKCLKAGRYGGL